MKSYFTIAALSAFAALVSLSAQAQTAPMTRAQVSAELAAARYSGALEHVPSEGFGLPTPAVQEVAPANAPAAAAAQPEAPTSQSGLTRAEVRAELARARAAGEMDFAAAEVNGSSPYEARPVNPPVYARQGSDR
ncbi:MAG: DUF4148 domain-containing protein [Methylibium sp.]|uniref:DUF4148 domain-containing protein n=1 Tax=Methylibium sp. TaxID=2067992 RepID=UPI001830D903|nr:DUF4148 domain-containing protein [Methylibium sp.]MBA3598967.1 DUF4148 domain-containing protein [Methylibium sp.]